MSELNVDSAETADGWSWPGGWQNPWRYLVVWQGGSWVLTWHAPWCWRCEHPGSGWRFRWSRGHVAGLGFELTYTTAEDAASTKPLQTEAEHAEAMRELDAILARWGGGEPPPGDADAHRLQQFVILAEAFERWHPDHRIVGP
jgi:hypothetical protein